MHQNHTPSNPTLPGVIYVGRTEGETVTVIGKVGQVENPTFLESRVVSYRVADRIFHFVLEAAFAVELPPNTSILDVEGWVHSTLEGHGLTRFGENFVAPDASMTFLARLTEAAIAKLGYRYTRLDIDALQERARALNSKTWKKLKKRQKEKTGPSVYQTWLDNHSGSFQGFVALARPNDYLRNVLALGYLLKDLASGSGLSCIEVPLLMGGALKVYPSTLESALFEAKAEADLFLTATTSFSACPSSLDEIPVSPFAMTVLLGQNLEMVKVPNTFLMPTKDQPASVEVSPDHLAALGLLGGDRDERCHYEGLGVRALIPLDMRPLLRQYPDHLPGVRFWLGVQHCLGMGIRLQDFELPRCVAELWDRISNAALIMKMSGRPIPEERQAWVAHAWIPAGTAPGCSLD